MSKSVEAPPSSWTREAIEQFLETEDLEYQKIPLPYGLSTPGNDRQEIYDICFGDSLTGQSVLDIGSFLGAFCIEALARGARSAVGLEVNPRRLAQARTIASIRNVDPEYRLVDLEHFETEETFDVVLCLNVLHHLFEPIAALRKLARMTSRHLILEVASVGGVDRRHTKLSNAAAEALSTNPLIYVGGGAMVTSDLSAGQKWFFTAPAIQEVLNNHMKLFARVELLPSPFEGRFIIRATRRRIEHLLVVSGPSAVGKSTFISWLQAGMPEGLRLKCPEGAGEWPQVSANDLFKTDDRPAQLDEPELPGMVLHYDFLRPYHTRSHIYERDQALELLSCAENLTVIVLNVGQERLIRQFKEAKLCRESSISQGQASVVQGNRGRSRIPNAVRRGLRRLRKGKPRNATPKKDKLREYREEMLPKYETPGWVEEWYEAWRRYVAESHPTAEVIEMTVPESAK